MEEQNMSTSLPGSMACSGYMTSKDSLTHGLCHLRTEDLKDGYVQLTYC